MNDRDSVALHEAGHALGALASGCTVTRLSVDADGAGACYSATAPAGLSGAIRCVCGGAAVRLLGDRQAGAANLSLDDHAAAERCLREARLTPDVTTWRWLRRQAERLVADHAPAIRALADALRQAGTLRVDDLAELCRREPALMSFAKLYPTVPCRPAPAPTTPRAARQRRPATISGPLY